MERPRDAMTFGAPGTEALHEGSAQKGFWVLSLEGSLFPLSLTATHEPIEILGSLWGRWKSPDAAGSKPCGSRNTAIQNKRISAIINNHRGASGPAPETKNRSLAFQSGGKVFELSKCKEILMREGVSRVAMSRDNGCLIGYIEYMGDILLIAIYEFRDIGVLAGKISPDISHISLDTCSEMLYTPYGYIAYAESFEDLCERIASKMKRISALKRGR